MPIHYALSHPIDILHMDWPHSFYVGRNRLVTGLKRLMYSLGLRKLRHHPLVWTAHNLTRHNVETWGEIRMMQKLIDCCDGVMVMSHAAERALRDVYHVADSTRVAVIPHGHYIGAYPDDLSRGDARERLGIAPDARVVLLFGRIQEYKGVDLLIEAFAEIARAGDVLLVAGPADDARLVADLKNLGRDRCPDNTEVRLNAELIPADRLQEYFRACDLVVLPFRSILNSGSFMLAMSFGCCVVAPRLGSIPEIACPSGYFGYDAEDPNGLAEALRQALGHPELLERGRRCLEFVRRRYAWPGIGRRVRRLYEEVLGRA